jgi:hypothetical protein
LLAGSFFGQVTMRSTGLAMLLSVIISACATGNGASEFATVPESTGGRRMMTYTAIATAVPVSPDSAYQLLIRVYANLQLPMVSVDAKRTVGNDDLKVRHQVAGIPMQNVVDCGEKLGSLNAETWDIDMNLLSYIRADPNGGSQVLTRIQAEGNRPEGTNSRQTVCSTTGALEKKIGDAVAQLAVSK